MGKAKYFLKLFSPDNDDDDCDCESGSLVLAMKSYRFKKSVCWTEQNVNKMNMKVNPSYYDNIIL